jgi:signal transduction histidine kinase
VGKQYQTRDAEASTPELTVENTGPPVPPYEIPSLFEPFCRLPATERLVDAATTSTRRGAGLGLSIVRSVAHAHGGDVHAAPVRTEAPVRVRLPAAPEQSQPNSTGPS